MYGLPSYLMSVVLKRKLHVIMVCSMEKKIIDVLSVQSLGNLPMVILIVTAKCGIRGGLRIFFLLQKNNQHSTDEYITTIINPCFCHTVCFSDHLLLCVA